MTGLRVMPDKHDKLAFFLGQTFLHLIDDCDKQLSLVQRKLEPENLVCRNVVEQLGILKNILHDCPEVAIVGSIFELETGRVISKKKTFLLL